MLAGRRSVVVASIVLMVLGGLALPAAANHEPPHDGPDHRYGDMVDYPLVFPLEGTKYWFEDWFWAARGDGLHHAQDLMAPKMTPVLAAATGTVIWVNWSQSPGKPNPDRCCTMVIRHDDGWESWYIHLNNDTPGTDDGAGWGIAPGIEVGTRVAAGQLIGWVGDSQSAEDTPPHLHFELYDPHHTQVNPYRALRAAEGKAVCVVSNFAAIDTLLAHPGLLRRGARGVPVTELQQALFVLGFDPEGVDGVFGPRTEVAVRAFQDKRGLRVDGVVGSQTRSALASLREVSRHASVLSPDGRILRLGSSGADVAELQHLLATVGQAPGPADGAYGPKTAGAVRAHQEKAGILIDGIVGPGTRSSLAATLGLTGLVNCSR